MKEKAVQFSIDDYIDGGVSKQSQDIKSEEFQVNNVAYDFSSLFVHDRGIIEKQNNNSSLAILGNSIEVLQDMREGSVDLIFADAPYNIGKDFGNDSDKWESVKAYVDWCKIWIDECVRVLKDTGTMYFMTATQHMPYLDVYVSEKYNVLCRIVWTYDSSGVQSKQMYGSLYIDDAPDAIRDDLLFKMLVAEGSIEVVESAAQRKALEQDPTAGALADGRKASKVKDETKAGEPPRAASGGNTVGGEVNRSK